MFVGVFEIAQHITTVMLCLVRNWGVEAAYEALGCWDLCLTQRLGAKYCRTTTAALGTQHPLQIQASVYHGRETN